MTAYDGAWQLLWFWRRMEGRGMTESFEEDPDLWVREVTYTVRRPADGWPGNVFYNAIGRYEWYFAAELLLNFYRARGVE
jgi:hypothetical protein